MKTSYREIINHKITLRLLEYYKTNGEDLCEYAHWHKNAEICRVVEGECDFLIKGVGYHAKRGDIVAVGSGEIHTLNKSHGDCKIDICTFDPTLLYNASASTELVLPYIAEGELSARGIGEEVSECFSIMYDEICKNDGGAEVLLQAALLRLYGLLIRHFPSVSDKAAPSNRALFQKLLDYIGEHYTEAISLESAAEKLNYSPVYISSVFKSCSGINFKYYLDNIRIMEAVELLSATDMTVTEVSRACGFDNIRTFNNVFKKITNKTPSQIKKTS